MVVIKKIKFLDQNRYVCIANRRVWSPQFEKEKVKNVHISRTAMASLNDGSNNGHLKNESDKELARIIT